MQIYKHNLEKSSANLLPFFFGSKKRARKRMCYRIFLNSQILLVFLWFCCKGSFCSFTAQQNEELRRIVSPVYWTLLYCVIRTSALLSLSCRLKNKYYKQKVVLSWSHQAGCWSRDYTSGKVLFLPSTGHWQRLPTALPAKWLLPVLEVSWCCCTAAISPDNLQTHPTTSSALPSSQGEELEPWTALHHTAKGEGWIGRNHQR